MNGGWEIVTIQIYYTHSHNLLQMHARLDIMLILA